VTNLGNLVLIASLAVILMTALFFVFCRRYEDGMLGNAALVFMSIACGILLWDAWEGGFVPPDPEWALLTLCCAVFLLRHWYRFVMFHWHGAFGWQPPKDHRARKYEADTRAAEG